MVFTHAYILACMHLSTALADDDAAGRNELITKCLHAQALGM
jgi:hypothetical protein